MTIQEFLRKYGTACGSNWTAMIFTAIKAGLPEVFETIDPKKVFTIGEAWQILIDNEKRIAEMN